MLRVCVCVLAREARVRNALRDSGVWWWWWCAGGENKDTYMSTRLCLWLWGSAARMRGHSRGRSSGAGASDQAQERKLAGTRARAAPRLPTDGIHSQSVHNQSPSPISGPPGLTSSSLPRPKHTRPLASAAISTRAQTAAPGYRISHLAARLSPLRRSPASVSACTAARARPRPPSYP